MQSVRFVKTLLRFQFGEVVEKVVDALIVRGGQPIDAIASFTKLSMDETSRALVVLIQHDIVQSTLEVVERPGRKPDAKEGAAAAAVAASAAATNGKSDEKKSAAAATADAKSAKGKAGAAAAAASSSTAAAAAAAGDKKKKSTKSDTAATATAAAAAPATAAKTDDKSDKSLKGDEVTRTIYHVDCDIVRCRARFPTYCVAMRERYGREGELIMDSFCTKGKLTLNQLVENCLHRMTTTSPSPASAATAAAAAAADSKSSSSAAAASAGGNPNSKRDQKWRAQLNEVFRLMVSGGYLKRADTVTAAAAKVALKKRKVEEAVETHTEKQTKANQAKKKAKLTRTTAEVKFDAAAEDAEEITNPNLFWTIAHEQFLFDAKKEALCDYVLKKCDATYAAIVRAMMKSYPTDPLRRPLPVTVEAIIANLKEDRGPDLSAENVSAYLDEMRVEQPPIIAETESGFLVRPTEVFTEMKSRHAISIARDKCGALGGRVFKLLTVHKRLEEKQIAEFAVAPKKKVRETCYALFKSKFVSLQEVPRGADRNPGRSFFLWGVPNDKVNHMLCESFLFSWCNVRIRFETEEAAIRPLQQKVHIGEPLTTLDAARWEQWGKAADRLENAMSRLNQLITLFKDF